MLLRLFVYAENEKEANAIYNDCTKEIASTIEETYAFAIKPYWKVSGMFEIEIDCKLNIEREKFGRFLAGIADYWDELGGPVPNNLVASEMAVECRYIRENIALVDVYLENEENYLIPNWEEEWKQIYLSRLEQSRGKKES